MDVDSRTERFSRILGDAVTSLWADLPHDVQRSIFELAVMLGHESEHDESLREQLAQHLHGRHRRTAARA